MQKSPQETDKKRILLIGGAGYIGTVLTGQLLKAGHRVRCLDLLLYKNGQSIAGHLNDPNYEFVRGDLTDPATAARALEGMTDVVILAGLVGDPITKKYPEASDKINLHGMQRLISSLNGKGLDRVIFISTCSNYGLIPENAMAAEDYELTPLSLYAKAKVAIEKQLMALKGSVDYAPTILRFATAFGLSPRMRFDLSLNEFAREMHLGRDLLVFDAHTWRPYCHVMDFSRVIQRVLAAPRSSVAFEVFNAGGEMNNATKQMIVDAVKKILPNAPVRYQEKGPDPRNYKVDFSKIRSVLDFVPQYSIEDGVREIVQALKQGVFDEVDSNRSYYGNYELTY